jgi:hypothetical protein
VVVLMVPTTAPEDIGLRLARGRQLEDRPQDVGDGC